MINTYVESIRKALQEQNWYCALALTLALPDICGGLDKPKELSSKKRFVDWYDQYIAPKFPEVFSDGIGDLLLTGADCYALRCSFLHNGTEDISAQRAQELLEKFYFVEPLKNWSFNTRTCGTTLIVQVDRFCSLICNAVEIWVVTHPINEYQFLTIYNPKTDGIPL